jgi:murein L,D-transpeptidase YafK
MASTLSRQRPTRIPSPALALLLVLGSSPAMTAEVPSSPRSREAADRVQPGLEKDLARKGLALGSPIFLRIFKDTSELELWVRGKERFELFRTYPICTFSGDLGPKQQAGDMQAPEGFYRITPRQMNPMSRFHLSFDLGYPNAYDQAWGRTGSALMIHGNCVSIGCYAMTDPSIEEIWTLAAAALRSGQGSIAVHIFPFRMTAERLEANRASEWFDFWSNLKEGYDRFEKERVPPQVSVRGRRYQVMAAR